MNNRYQSLISNTNESNREFFRKHPDKLPPSLQLKLLNMTGTLDVTENNLYLLFPDDTEKNE